MEQFLNNASTALNGAINNSVTSIVVANGGVFPASGNFRLVIESEIMLCTARSGNTLTVTRGYENSIANSHADGVNIDHIYTKGSLETLLSDYQVAGGWASRPTTNLRKGQEYYATDLLQAQWYYDGTNWNLTHPTYIDYAKRADTSTWTAINQSTWTFTNKNGILEVVAPDTALSNNDIRGFYKTHGYTAPFSFTAIINPTVATEQSQTFYMGFRDSVSGRLISFYHAGVNETLGVMQVEYWNSVNSWSSTQSTGHYTNFQTVRWMKAEDDGTNVNVYACTDGKTFCRHFQASNTAWLTNNRAQFFFGFFRSSNNYITGAPSYFHLLGLKEN